MKIRIEESKHVWGGWKKRRLRAREHAARMRFKGFAKALRNKVTDPDDETGRLPPFE